MATKKKSELIPSLKPAIEKGYNILLTGIHGIGKTYAVQQAVEDLGWKMKYYSTSTLDPYVDLVGVPVPMDTGTENPWLRMIRPQEINEVDVVFFDELNRADPRTLNAVFEIVQFRTINGEHLPNLKAVIGACNPAGDAYNVDELDPALIDRFHLYYDLTPKSPRPYLLTKYPRDLVDAFNSWWTNHNTSKRETYISPRRLDMMMDVYCATKSLDLLEKSIPGDVMASVDFNALKSRIAVAERGEDVQSMDMQEKFANTDWYTQDTVSRNLTDLVDFIEKNPNDPFVVQNASDFVRDQRIGAEKLAVDYGMLLISVHAANPGKIDEWKAKWGKTKSSQVRSFLRREAQSNSDYSAIAKAI